MKKWHLWENLSGETREFANSGEYSSAKFNSWLWISKQTQSPRQNISCKRGQNLIYWAHTKPIPPTQLVFRAVFNISTDAHWLKFFPNFQKYPDVYTPLMYILGSDLHINAIQLPNFVKWWKEGAMKGTVVFVNLFDWNLHVSSYHFLRMMVYIQPWLCSVHPALLPPQLHEDDQGQDRRPRHVRGN